MRFIANNILLIKCKLMLQSREQLQSTLPRYHVILKAIIAVGIDAVSMKLYTYFFYSFVMYSGYAKLHA